MIKITRKRYVITRNNETEIFCGLARNFEFKKISEIGDTAIKSYLSEKKALSSFKSSWYNWEKEDVKIIAVIEAIESL